MEQPTIGTSEIYILVDDDYQPNKIKEIKVLSTTAAVTLSTGAIKLIKIDDVSHSHKYIRSIGNYEFSITLGTSLPASSQIMVFFDYLKWEFINEISTPTCSIKVSKTSAELANSGCTRTSNFFTFTLASALSAGTKYLGLITNANTPDYIKCNPLRPVIYATDNAGVFKAISSDMYHNDQDRNFIKDSTLTYNDFVGHSEAVPVQFNKYVYNEISIESADGLRFHDDFSFTLATTMSGALVQMATTSVYSYDSQFGLASYPMLISTNTYTKLLNQLYLSVATGVRFAPTIYNKLPTLRLQLTDTKVKLTVPTSVTVWAGIGSLPFYVELSKIPYADVTFAITATGTTTLTISPSTLTLGLSNRIGTFNP